MDIRADADYAAICIWDTSLAAGYALCGAFFSARQDPCLPTMRTKLVLSHFKAAAKRLLCLCEIVIAGAALLSAFSKIKAR